MAFTYITQIILRTFTTILSVGVCSNCIKKEILASQCQDQFKSVNAESLQIGALVTSLIGQHAFN